MSDQTFSTTMDVRAAEALASVLGAAIGADLQASPSAGPAAGQGWLMALTVSGAAAGEITVWVDAAGAAAIAGALAGNPQPPETQVAGLLREMGAQAADVLAAASDFAGASLALAGVSPAPAIEDGATFAVTLPSGVVLMAVRAEVSHPGQGTVSTEPTASASAAVAPRSTTDPLFNRSPNIDVVLDVELPLVVRFGRTVMSLKQLAGLGPGSIVDMGRSPDDAVELMVSDRVIAYGEVVVVDGNYGIRVTELASRADRIRALEG